MFLNEPQKAQIIDGILYAALVIGMIVLVLL